jgi:hypothetical protein
MRILDLWRRRAKLIEIGKRISERRFAAANTAICSVESAIEEHIGASVFAVACVMLWAIEYDDSYDSDGPGLPHAVLGAIRSQLAGVIAADAERLLTSDEEASA